MVVIPAKAGIQEVLEETGFRVKPGMTENKESLFFNGR